MKLIILLASVGLISQPSFASKDHEHPKAATNAKFEQLKKLVGTWEGKIKMGEKEETTKVTYTLTSGGTAIEEKLFTGTPHEMVSMYYIQGESVGMTHYCALGNQPKLKLKSINDTSVHFLMSGTQGLRSPSEEHMHELKVTWNGNDSMTQDWTSYAKGKKKETSTFSWTRKN